MKRFTLVLTLCLIDPSSRAQDEPLWQYIGSTTNQKTGEITIFSIKRLL